LLVGASAEWPDLEYATGFRVVDPIVFLRTREAAWLVVSQLEYNRAARVCKGMRVHAPETLGLDGARRRRMSNWVLALLKRAGVKSVTVPPAFPMGIGSRLQRHGVRVRIADRELFPQRAVKRPDEIKKIRECQQAAVIAMRMAMDLIRQAQPDADGVLRIRHQPLTSEDVRRRIAEALFQHGCSSRDTIVAGGRQAADPHERGSGSLRAGETIVIDIFPQHLEHGYWGDLTRTVVRGKPSRSLRRMYEAVRAAQAAALDRVRPGVACASVHRAAARELDRRGFRTTMLDGRGVGFIHGVGHGVGLSIHESPSLGMAPGRLRIGNVITVEPGLYYPDVGGIRIEDTVVVTSSGWRYLAPCEKRFEW
jgi:Xaa-Pro aminopeptidase